VARSRPPLRLATYSPIQQRCAYGNISAAEFIDFALDRSGLRGDRLALLSEYLQWLYGQTKPTILPDAFE
jgi:hypothetical protein